MKPKSKLTLARPGRRNRRQFLKQLASMGIAATVFPGMTRPAAASADSKNLSVFAWAGYEYPEFYPQYLKKYGNKPDYSFYADEEEAFQKVRAGYRPDISFPCSNVMRRWRDAGLVSPLDTSRIEHWDDIYPQFLDISGVQLDGKYYLMPWDWGFSSVIYRTDLVDPKEESYSLLLDDRYAGRIAMYNSVDAIAAVSGGLAGVENPMVMNDDEIERARAVMEEIHERTLFYWSDITEIYQALATGEVVAAWAWSEALPAMQENNIPVKFIRPREGLWTYVCGLCLHTIAPEKEQAAYDFLSSMLSPESGLLLMDWYSYGHANRKSIELLDPEARAAFPIRDPEKFFSESNYYNEIPPATRKKLVAIFNEVKAGF